MPNLNIVLKGEITGLGRKEIKAVVDPIRKTNTGLRNEIAVLKRLVASMQRELNAATKPAKARAEADEASSGSFRFSAKGLKSLRAKLGLSAAEFGQLVGASGQSIYNWEAGKALPRASQQASLASIRGIGSERRRSVLQGWSETLHLRAASKTAKRSGLTHALGALMTFPSHLYQCSECQRTFTSDDTAGCFSYQAADDFRFPLKQRSGWYYDCDSHVPVEDLRTEDLLQEIVSLHQHGPKNAGFFKSLSSSNEARQEASDGSNH